MELPALVNIPDQNLVQYQPQKNPHTYAIAHFAYHNALEDGEHQSCIVSGESGAGKTVACKYLMSYLAVLSSKKVRECDDRLTFSAV